MHSTKKLLLSLIALILVFGTASTGMAAANKTIAKDPAPKAPIVIEGDQLSFSDLTGDVFAQGNVTVTQSGATITSDQIKGNTKQSEIWADGNANFLQQGVNIVGSGTHYNYQTNNGFMLNAKGKVDRERITGNNIDMLPGEIIIHDGTTTGCPAKIPDYHVSADRVEIWPGDKMIAYNAKFWIKSTVIFSLPKYQKSLKNDEGESEFPRIGYGSEGFYIKQYLEYPIGGHVAAFTDLSFSSKDKFQPEIGLIDREKNYNLSVVQGQFRDGDSNWVKKEPEFKFDYFSHRLGSLPVSYTFTGVFGTWRDPSKTSWHQDYSLYFSHDTIKLNKTMQLSLGTGVERVLESYDDSTRDVFKFDTTLYKQWSAPLNTWVGYHYTKNNSSLFAYNDVELGRELDVGFSYKIDRMNTISFNQSYDLNNNRIYDQDYTWSRNLHCWQADITYRAKRHQINWTLSTTRW